VIQSSFTQKPKWLLAEDRRSANKKPKPETSLRQEGNGKQTRYLGYAFIRKQPPIRFGGSWGIQQSLSPTGHLGRGEINKGACTLCTMSPLLTANQAMNGAGR
jgi:hypothetical protein